MSHYPTVVTAVIANRELLDGLAVRVQEPNSEEAERAYLQMTAQTPYKPLDHARQRVLELLQYHKNRLSYRQRTELYHFFIDLMVIYFKQPSVLSSKQQE